jgi:hypothetical protein
MNGIVLSLGNCCEQNNICVAVWVPFLLPWEPNDNTGYLGQHRNLVARNNNDKYSADEGAM